jgi:hypothetical protein
MGEKAERSVGDRPQTPQRAGAISAAGGGLKPLSVKPGINPLRTFGRTPSVIVLRSMFSGE